MLEHRLTFPVVAYVKENGFLGIVSYNEETDALFATTKSAPDGDFARWLKEMINEKLSNEAAEKMKQFSKEHNVSFVFECVDMKMTHISLTTRIMNCSCLISCTTI